MKTELLRALDALGVTLWWDGEALRYRAPSGALSPALREALREDRDALIALAQARGGALLPADRAHWPPDLVAQVAAQERSPGAAPRQAVARAVEDWLRLRAGFAEDP